MALNTRGSDRTTHNIRYSAFLGMTYLSTEETEKAINEEKAKIGEVEVRKGFTGNSGHSAAARQALRRKGITEVSVSGRLTSAWVKPVQGSDNKSYDYLTVGITDGDEIFYLSAPLALQSTQMLVRKLVNATPGEEITTWMFATFGQREGQTRAYANHAAVLRRGGEKGDEIKGIDVQETLVPQIEAALAALRSSNVTDNTVLNAQRNSISIKFHKDLMEKVSEKFADHYKDNADAGVAAQTVATQQAVKPAAAPSFDEFDDDIPFAATYFDDVNQ